MNVNEHVGYKIGTKVGLIKRYMSRNRVQFFANATLDVSEVPVSDMSLREIVSKISHAYITTFCTLPFQKPAVLTCCYMTKTYGT
jgi:hypothetical protein